MRRRVGAAGRPRLGPLAGPAAGPAVPVDDHAVQVPLVAALLVADGQLGRPLLRPDPLADRRAGPGVGLGPRRPVRRGRRPDHPRHHARRSSSTPRACSRSSASSRPTASPSWAAAPRSSCGGRSARSTPTRRGYEIVPERGGQFQDPKPRRKPEVVKALRRRPRPAGGPRLPRQRQEPQAAQRRRRGGPPLHHLRPPGEHRAGHPQAARLGRPGRARSPIATRPTRCSTTSIASPGPWALNAPARGTVSSAPT